MATYVITGKSSSGEPLVSVQISAVNQEQHVVEELDVVGAVRAFLSSADGVEFVVAQKYEQVITVV
jgi:hypothetical protein